MRPTPIRLGDMPGPKVYNVWWGDTSLVKQKGVVSYAVSPFRQRAFGHLFSGYIFNGYKRLATQAPYWVIPFAMGYSIYSWAKSYDHWQGSKEGHLALMEHGEEGGH